MRVFQHLGDAGLGWRAGRYPGHPRAGQIAPGADPGGWDDAGADEPMRQPRGAPGGSGGVGLYARPRPPLPRLADEDLDRPREPVIHRAPIDPGARQRAHRAVGRREPITEGQPLRIRRATGPPLRGDLAPSGLPRRRHAVHGACWTSLPQPTGSTTCMTPTSHARSGGEGRQTPVLRLLERLAHP
jgi:hypothetical protein